MTTGRSGGALFRLSIPATTAVAEPARPHADADGLRAARCGLLPVPPMDILLVEDGPENRMVIMEWLAPGGHRITCAASGEEALRAVAERPFDLILMDIRLEGMDGTEAARRIRALPDETSAMTPIIALTANASLKDRETYTAAGIDEVLTKPVNPDALTDALARHAPSGACRAGPMEESQAGDAPAPVSALAPAVAERLASLFVTVAHGLDAALCDAQKAGDRDEMERIAHRLRGSAGTYGYPRLAGAAAALERDLRHGVDGERLMTAVAEVRAALGSVVGVGAGNVR
ncbi:response regulator [Azospirillum thermophilum]|uniref:Response regulator n=1 Tax=Azospirillum thermophilum TaxID=2202148 RepID=A0A2S2CKD3_9PROT|nr:response regulator [Azospirillum thermophilum]AWK84932.1 hypothetical protein DEW08_00925 [Azospirillum thermophilum]